MNKEEIADLASALVGEYYAPASERDYVDDDFRYMYSVPPAALVPSSLSGWAVYDPGNGAGWVYGSGNAGDAFPQFRLVLTSRDYTDCASGVFTDAAALLPISNGFSPRMPGFAVSAVSLEVLGDDTDDARGRLERPLP